MKRYYFGESGVGFVEYVVARNEKQAIAKIMEIYGLAKNEVSIYEVTPDYL